MIRSVRLSDALIAQVDRWAKAELGAASRSDAIRELVEAGLRAKRKGKAKTVKPAQAPAIIRTREFLSMAEQFFGGYKLIPDRHPLDFAKYFLFCRAIEVALKAWRQVVATKAQRGRA